jgi:hypothetical protein
MFNFLEFQISYFSSQTPDISLAGRMDEFDRRRLSKNQNRIFNLFPSLSLQTILCNISYMQHSQKERERT